MRDIQVLWPMNRGGLSARSLNIALQAALNPPGELRVQLGRSATASGYRALARLTTSGCFARISDIQAIRPRSRKRT